jgi:predicted ArsR family transcriptional regulator
MERDRVTVGEAARRLGISESGVRKRVKRGQIDSTHEGGRVFVYLDSAGTEADEVPDNVPDKYTTRLEDEVEFLRDQVRRQQEIIGQQAISLRALSAPQDEPENVRHAAQDKEPPTEAESPENQSSPWWRFWR